jgi:hypothetical protein
VADDALSQTVSCATALEGRAASEAAALKTLQVLDTIGRTDGYDHVVGVLPKGAMSAMNAAGLGLESGQTGPLAGGVLVEAGNGPAVLAHEIGHNLGVGHTDDAPANGYWISHRARQRGTDFMNDTIVENPWASDPTVQAMLTRLQLSPGRSSSGSRVAAGGSLAVSGVVGADGKVDAGAWTRVDAPADPPAEGEGALQLQHLAGNGDVLASSAVAAVRGAGTGGHLTSSARVFSARVPLVEGTRTLRLRDAKGTVLLSREVTAAAPEVTVTGPVGSLRAGETSGVSWTATDADGGELTASVAAQVDGGAWRTLLTGVKGTSASFPVTRDLEGEVRLRVTVSDGVNSTSVDSDPFTVEVGSGAAGDAHPGRARPRSATSTGQGRRCGACAPTAPTCSSSSDPELDAEGPAYAPDGERIAFTTDVHAGGETDGYGPEDDVVLREADGTLRNLTMGELGGGSFCPDWSPDGRTIAHWRSVASGPLRAEDGGRRHASGGDAARAVRSDRPRRPGELPALVAGRLHDRLRRVRGGVGGPGRRHLAAQGRLPAHGRRPSAPLDARRSGDVVPGQHDPAVGGVVVGAADGTDLRQEVPRVRPGGRRAGRVGPQAARRRGTGSGSASPGTPPRTSSATPVCADVPRRQRPAVPVRPAAGDGRGARRLLPGRLVAGGGRAPRRRRPARPAGARPGRRRRSVRGERGRCAHPLEAAGTFAAGQVPAATWDLDGDGQHDDAEGWNPSVVMNDGGTRTISLRLTAADGTSVTDTATVMVSPAPPVLEELGMVYGAVGVPTTISVPFTDPGSGGHGATLDVQSHGNHAAQVDFADGRGTATATFTPTREGMFPATMVVCDGVQVPPCAVATATVFARGTAEPLPDVWPKEGTTAGGTRMTASGLFMEGVTSVHVGEAAVPFTQDADGTVRFTSPPSPTGGPDRGPRHGDDRARHVRPQLERVHLRGERAAERGVGAHAHRCRDSGQRAAPGGRRRRRRPGPAGPGRPGARHGGRAGGRHGRLHAAGRLRGHGLLHLGRRRRHGQQRPGDGHRPGRQPGAAPRRRRRHPRQGRRRRRRSPGGPGCLAARQRRRPRGRHPVGRGGPGGPAAHGEVELDEAGDVRFTPAAGYVGPLTLRYQAGDGLDLAEAEVAVELTGSTGPVDLPPSVEAGEAASGVEGAPVAVSGTASDDGASLVTAWSADRAGCTLAQPDALSTTLTCTDDGPVVLTLTADDGVNAPVTDSTTVSVANAAPTARFVEPSDGSVVPVDAPLAVVVDVTDAGGGRRPQLCRRPRRYDADGGAGRWAVLDDARLLHRRAEDPDGDRHRRGRRRCHREADGGGARTDVEQCQGGGHGQDHRSRGRGPALRRGRPALRGARLPLAAGAREGTHLHRRHRLRVQQRRHDGALERDRLVAGPGRLLLHLRRHRADTKKGSAPSTVDLTITAPGGTQVWRTPSTSPFQGGSVMLRR